jgi:hypothetical protein
MIGLILFIFSSRCYRPRLAFKILVYLSKLAYRLRGKSLVIDSKRFEAAAWTANFTETESGLHERCIELVVVSTSKDFDILPDSVNYAQKALVPYKVDGTRVIVPNRDISLLQQVEHQFDLPIQAVDETTLVSRSQFQRLTDAFGKRDTWVLQQLLKVQAVLKSTSDAVLILDSDTVLLRPRPWFSKSGKQILMPTMEYNAPYYQFLKKLNISESVPEFSFISHHMLMQPKILTHILESLDLLEIDALITYVCENADPDVSSPICIEYELYGQYLYRTSPKGYFLERWSNVSIARRHSRFILKSPIARFALRNLYNSVSFHSWS